MDQRIKGSIGVSLGWVIAFLFLLPLTVHAFTITGSIVNGRNPDNTFVTYVYADIGEDFTGALPGGIASVIVTGPGGLPVWTQDATHNDLPFSGKLYSERKYQSNFPGFPAMLQSLRARGNQRPMAKGQRP